MNKLGLSIFLLLFPVLAMADDSLSFAPPPSDISVVLLGSIFGYVDGVLHGNGSQILGSMFAVFNAAVLALGGIVIMYTLIVSTMNTAHEGQMLGQKWSSIWVPIRATIGLTFLIPKASGYCLMQVFVMWIVVQGVGAADKIWDAALNYLNQGGVIIMSQTDPTQKLLDPKADGSDIMNGAQVILAGQVCMLGLQTQLQKQHDYYMTQKGANNASGPCAGTPSDVMKDFCQGSVPNFIGSINVVEVQRQAPKNPTQSSIPLSVPMPNFDSSTPYAFLNGICGTLNWNTFPKDNLKPVKEKISSVSDNDIETASLSRAIAIQQMYVDLANIAQVMVNNNPHLLSRSQTAEAAKNNFSDVAIEQYGVPHTATGPVCTDSSTDNCIVWGSASATTTPPLFNGTEFKGALADYNTIMLPTLNLIQQAKSQDSADSSRKFIKDSTTQGWITAGSYFFNLISLNVNANKSAAGLMDKDTGLDTSTMDPSVMVGAFGQSTMGQCNGDFAKMCMWFNQEVDKVLFIAQMINNYGSPSGKINTPTLGKQTQVIDKANSSTVFGFTTNESILKLPGQPGTKPLQFADMMHISIDDQIFQLPKADFPCGGISFLKICLGQMFGDLFYNDIIRMVYNALLIALQTLMKQVLVAFLLIPLQGMAVIFKQGLDIISTPGVNPIVALANMGTYYINFVSNLWLDLIELAIISALLPLGVGMFIFALIGLSLPLLIAWLGVMLSVGFTTAYYVPMLPYMIFTFGVVSWLMAVVESMVAAPIVALGVTHPEGHEAFGKGEQAIMILLNIFLRPSMMIIGYITAIALSYVSVWVINAGFDNAIGFIQGSEQYGTLGTSVTTDAPLVGNVSGGYNGWAGIYAYFFSILVYTMMYLTLVTKSFGLISALPDKVLRWVGGTQESYGADTAQWGEEAKGKIDKAGDETRNAQQQMGKQLGGLASKGVSKMQGSKSSQEGPDATATQDEGDAGKKSEGAATEGGGAEAAAAG